MKGRGAGERQQRGRGRKPAPSSWARAFPLRFHHWVSCTGHPQSLSLSARLCRSIQQSRKLMEWVLLIPVTIPPMPLMWVIEPWLSKHHENILPSNGRKGKKSFEEESGWPFFHSTYLQLFFFSLQTGKRWVYLYSHIKLIIELLYGKSAVWTIGCQVGCHLCLWHIP